MDEQAEETVIFLHLPKTAGTTLHRILDREYPGSAVFTIGVDAHADIEQFYELPEAELEQVQLLRGHMPFGLHEHLPQAARYFTMLRDPIERVISNYYYIRRSPEHYLYPTLQATGWDLAALLHSQLPVMLDNGQTRLLSGVWGDVGYGKMDESHLALAQRHLRDYFAVVGLQEQFDSSLLLMQKAFGWRRIEYQKRNVTRNRPAQETLSAETLAAIREANLLDLQLYEYARQLFRRQLRQQGALFRARVRLFPLENRLRRRYWAIRQVSLRQMIRERWEQS